jgi:hypothetical protein
LKDDWNPDVQRAIGRSIEGIDSSAMFLQLYNKNLADEPLALMQLGYALMIGKPIGVLVKKGEEVPEKLRAAADLVEEFDPEDPQSLTAATKKLLSILEGRR